MSVWSFLNALSASLGCPSRLFARPRLYMASKQSASIPMASRYIVCASSKHPFA